MGTLLAEDLLLLLLDEQKGRLRTSYADTVLGGALLTELALLGAVAVPEKTGVWRTAKVHATGTPVEDPLLQEALDVVARKERSAEDLVTRLGKGRRDVLGQRLVERGILQRRDTRMLGIFPGRRWPTLDPSHEQALRHSLGRVLVEGAEPDDRTGALVALLAAIDRAHKVVDHEGLSSREVRRRAKQIAEGAWAAKAVRDAIAAATAATAGAVAATTAATSSG